MQESRGGAPLVLFAVLALTGATFPSARGAAAPASEPAPPPSYARDIAPLFQQWCVSCHGGDEPEGGLRLDSLAGVMRGGDAGPAVIPGDPEASLLVAKVERRHRPSMPPRRKLPAEAVARLRAWIAARTPR